MTSTTQPLSASFEPTKASEPTTQVGSAALNPSTRQGPVLTVVTPCYVDAPIPPAYQSVDEVVAEFERSPQMRAELKRARRWVAETVLATKPLTLRTLRLKKGLSQARLAEELGTQQPYIARIESGHADLRLDTCRRLAVALGVDLNTLDEALQRQGAA